MNFDLFTLVFLLFGALLTIGLGLYGFYEENSGSAGGRVLSVLICGVGFVVLVFLLFGIGVL